jgi:hypothetical protein
VDWSTGGFALSVKGKRFFFSKTLKPICPSHPVLFGVIKSRKMIWAGHVARMAERRGVNRVLVGKPEGKRQLGTPRRRWEDNIKRDLQGYGLDRAG